MSAYFAHQNTVRPGTLNHYSKYRSIVKKKFEKSSYRRNLFLLLGAPLRHQPVNMFEQTTFDRCPHRIENKINSLSPGKLCSRNKIAVSCYENNLIYLFFYMRGKRYLSQFSYLRLFAENPPSTKIAVFIKCPLTRKALGISNSYIAGKLTT